MRSGYHLGGSRIFMPNRDKEAPQEKVRHDSYLRSVEDYVEQNDNSFDGIINNMPDDKPTAQITREDVIEAEQKKKSILEELKKETPEAEKAKPVPRCFSCTEREIK